MIADRDIYSGDAPSKNKPWSLNKITRLGDGHHELLFDVDGIPSIKLTIKGSFSLKGCRVESIPAAA